MLLPEHRTALESLITKIYDAGLQPFENVAESGPGIVGGRTSPSGVDGTMADEQLTTDIISCVRLHCALQMRTRNRAILPPQCLLPVELWAAVFAHLNQHDLVSVSHVSHDWREAAVASGRLWTSPFFLSAAHATDCDCQRCSSLWPCASCGRARQPEPNPVHQVQTFLERSGSLPVNLRMAVFTRAAPSARANLDEVVRPHIRRIESLTFLTSDAEVIHELLESFTTFSALTFLTLDLKFSSKATWKCVERVQLEKLRVLNLSGPLYCDAEHFELRCPSVISLKAMFFTASHVLALLRTCPSVQDLQLEVGPRTVDAPSTETLDEIHALLKQARPRVVQITLAYEGDIAAILQLFGATDIPTFKIACAATEHMERDDLTRFLRNETGKSNHLECVVLEDNRGAYTSFRLTIRNDIQERTVTFDLSEANVSFRNLWARLSPSTLENITKLYVSSSLWPKLLLQGDPPGQLPITHAQIIVEEADTLGLWLQARAVALQEGSEHNLPQLEVLHFVRTTPHESHQLDEDFSEVIRKAFCLGSKLQLLQLEGFGFDGDVAALQTISHEVRLI